MVEGDSCWNEAVVRSNDQTCVNGLCSSFATTVIWLCVVEAGQGQCCIPQILSRLEFSPVCSHCLWRPRGCRCSRKVLLAQLGYSVLKIFKSRSEALLLFTDETLTSPSCERGHFISQWGAGDTCGCYLLTGPFPSPFLRLKRDSLTFFSQDLGHLRNRAAVLVLFCSCRPPPQMYIPPASSPFTISFCSFS